MTKIGSQREQADTGREPGLDSSQEISVSQINTPGQHNARTVLVIRKYETSHFPPSTFPVMQSSPVSVPSNQGVSATEND